LAAAARALQLAGGERLARRIGTAFGFEEVDIETGSTNGAAALVLGRQLSPRLYINYSIGLFESENVLRLRYRLTPNWSLEAQSGGTTSGGDIFYTIER
ncbi:MAG TPA: translocation/assembly module TamB domain-containing protein, partial [Sandaracinaceae bacterium]